jgi:osmotically-inducible protein OsmY
MTTATLTETDRLIRAAVQRQLDWEPSFDASGIAVTAKEGVITLTGLVDTYAAKLASERAAKRVKGVRAVANDLVVRLRIERADTDIAADAARALELRGVPETVQATVHNGRLTLTGSASWLFQRVDAEKAVRHIKGVRAVTNYIDVSSAAVARDVQRRIVQTLNRNADIDPRRVAVTVLAGVATLSGAVPTWSQRNAIEWVAASAPGISRVDNLITVDPVEPVDEMC